MVACRTSARAAPEGAATDGEGHALLLQLKESKLAYRAAFEAFRQQRGEIEALASEVTAARRSLMEGFDNWFAEAGMHLTGEVRPPVQIHITETWHTH